VVWRRRMACASLVRKCPFFLRRRGQRLAQPETACAGLFIDATGLAHNRENKRRHQCTGFDRTRAN
jgi:hypothetical protein